jgi:polyferredoxin
MIENEKEKNGAARKKYLWPFILATVFSLPFVDFAFADMFNAPQLVPDLHLSFINLFTIGPILIVSVVTALVFIFVSWFMSPSWCRFILPFYLLPIIPIGRWIFFGPFIGP